MKYDVSLIPDPAFLSEQALHQIREIATESFISQHNFDLVQKLTAVRGYAQLIAEEPRNLGYHIALRRATERMVELIRRKKLGNPELAGRLEMLLS